MTTRVLDSTNGESLYLKQGRVYFLDATFSPDGKAVLTAGSDGSLRLWDTETGEMICELVRQLQGVCRVAFSPDGTLIATASFDKTVRLWKSDGSQQIGAPLVLNEGIGDIAFSRDGSLLLASTMKPENAVRIWDIKTRELHKSLIQDAYEISAFAISPNQIYLLTGNSAGYSSLWEIETGKKIWESLPHRGPLATVEFNPDGESFLEFGIQDTEAILWDTQTLKPRRPPMRSEGPFLSAVFSSDGSRIFTANAVAGLVDNDGYWLTVRQWRIPPISQRSSERLKKRVEGLTGLRIDNQNHIQELSNQQLLELQQTLDDDLGQRNK